jgi:hypothetical protein
MHMPIPNGIWHVQLPNRRPKRTIAVSTPAVANPVGFEQYYKCTAEHMFGNEVIGPLHYEERLALALTMIELGDEVVDCGRTGKLLIKNSHENKYLFNQAMAKHWDGTGFAVREMKQVYGDHKKSKGFHKLLQLQQQLQLSKRCIDQKT